MSNSSIITTLGISLPGQALPYMGKIGLFDHSVVEKLTKSLLGATKQTFTGTWMDCSQGFSNNFPKGVSVGYHRIRNHHFITDAIKVLKNRELSIVDFYKHLGTDVVTKAGIPIIPESLTNNLARMLNISTNQIAPWVQMNILDIGVSVLSVYDTTKNVYNVLVGNAEWSFGYALKTFGGGSLKIIGGVKTANPILVSSGSIDILCGSVTAYKYYSQPFFMGVPVKEIMQSASFGIAISGILGVVEIMLAKGSMTNSEKVKLLSKRVLVGGALSAISKISNPVGISIGLGIEGFKLVKKISEDDNSYISAMPVKANLAKKIDEYIIENYVGKEKFKKMEDYLLKK